MSCSGKRIGESNVFITATRLIGVAANNYFPTLTLIPSLWLVNSGAYMH